jgi:antitoxin component YwqK of YwqJK toxin-antitoxin module
MGLKNGHWKWYSEAGKIDMEGHFKNGKQDSIWHYYFSSGQLSYIAHYKDDLRTNKWTYYYPNGALYRTGNYLNDLRTGIWQTWYEDSTLYYHGLKHGTWTNYYPGGLVPTIVAQYQYGRLHGVFKQYDRYGRIVYEIHYKRGLKDGPFYAFSENGQLISKKIFKQGRELGSQGQEIFSPY